ncbi:MAG TPA: TIGR01777 family oxidoreductase [Gemmatimonadaceae bacterium]|nr:TIGR01777 family oxidoreductase [Gemmatimonadaceae bacterium]
MSNDSRPLRIAITGATGFLGRALVARLAARGHSPVPITRHRDGAGRDAILWDPERGELHPQALAGIDAVVHLAGENLAQRWTDEAKRKIRDSRVKSTELLARTIAAMERAPRTWLSGSAVGIYGDRGDELLDESSPRGQGFLADVATAWENATAGAKRGDVRIVHLRTGLVLDESGGALAKMLPPFRLGLGGRIGSGQQILSWIALDDWTRAVEHLLGAGQTSGPVNLVAPTPVSNADFAHALGHALGRPALIPIPETAVRLAFGEMGEATLLASQRVVPTRLLGSGFGFEYETIDAALEAAVRS